MRGRAGRVLLGPAASWEREGLDFGGKRSPSTHRAASAQLPPWEGSELPPAPQRMGGARGEPQLLAAHRRELEEEEDADRGCRISLPVLR